MVKNTLKSCRWLFVMLLAVMFFAVPCMVADDAHAATGSLTTDKEVYLTSDPIKVTASCNTSDAWVGIYKYSDSVPSMVSYYWYNVSSYSNTAVDIYSTDGSNNRDGISGGAHLPVGKYYVYLFGSGSSYSDTNFVTGKTIWIIDAKTNASSYKCGDAINVTLNLSWEPKSGEWIGMYPETVTPAENKSIYWANLSGSTTQSFNMLAQTTGDTSQYKPGKFKIVLFHDGGYSNYDVVLPFTISDHSWGSGKVTTAATCNKTGVRTYTCPCGATKTETIAATGNHSYSAATCTAAKKCTVCGTTSGSALGHSFGNWYTVTPAKCGVAGSQRRDCSRGCGHYETGTIAALQHSYNSVVTKPTCTTGGYTTYTCKYCSNSYKGNETGPTDHAWNNGVVTTTPTCKTEGVMTYTCGNNASHTKTEPIPVLTTHTWNDGVVSKPATCKETGVRTYTCTVCNTTKNEKIDVLTTHTWNDGEVTKPATCKETGIMFHTCTVCKETKTEPIPLLTTHTWDEGTVTKTATCKETGVRTYTCSVCSTKKTEDIEILKTHTRPTKNDDCTKDQLCTVCQAVIEKADMHTSTGETNCSIADKCMVCNIVLRDVMEHNMAPADCDTPSMCQREGCGHTVGTVLGHAWTEATCEDDIYCKRCPAVQAGTHLGHDMVAATCVDNAYCKRTGCGHEEKDSALGHMKSEHEATCTTAQTCTRSGCDYVYVPALGHDWLDGNCREHTAKTCQRCFRTEGAPVGHKPGDEATCTTPQTCTVCGSRVKDATGHTLPQNAIPTCDKGVICVDCDFVLRPATGLHVWQSATCTDAKTCTACGTTEGKALGHDWLDATCTAAKTCDTCGVTEGTALGHKEGGKATCTESKICTVCKDILEAAKGHKAGEAATCTTDQTCTECATVLVKASGHREQILPGVAATCTSEGISDGKMCSKCQEILVVQSGVAKLTHVADSVAVTKATEKADGKIVKTCACGKVVSEETIYRIASSKLSITKTTYDGKKKTPSLKITDSKGNVLTKYRDYTVSYSKYRTNVGKYVYKITFKGNYAGTKSLTMTINPAKTAIKKPAAAKKAVTVKWKKADKQVTGYQVMVATNKAFTKNVKKAFVTKKKTTSKKMTGLKANKKYYVRVRTYKTVKGVKMYSAWSAVKTVKTK